MKKLSYTLFIFNALFIDACKTDNVSKLAEEVKAADACCERLSKDGSENTADNKVYKTAEANKKASSIIPLYFWDTKMMIR